MVISTVKQIMKQGKDVGSIRDRKGHAVLFRVVRESFTDKVR